VVWLVLTGYVGGSSSVLPHGLRMGILAATYIGYPIWAYWLGRHLQRLAREPAGGTEPGSAPERA
jgi:hypothetical protein